MYAKLPSSDNVEFSPALNKMLINKKRFVLNLPGED